MTDIAAIDKRDQADLPEEQEEAVLRALLSGRSVQAVRREFSQGGREISLDQIDALIARTWPVDGRARVRMVMTDLGKLDRLIAEFYKRALLTQDATAAAYASVCIKALERKHNLVGANAASSIDLQIVSQPQQIKSHQRIREAVYRIAGRRPPPAEELPADQIEPPAANGNGAAEPH